MTEHNHDSQLEINNEEELLTKINTAAILSITCFLFCLETSASNNDRSAAIVLNH
jgi:hypothetical protein